MEKEYLGDGTEAFIKDGVLLLTTRDGDAIYLAPEELVRLVKYSIDQGYLLFFNLYDNREPEI